MKKIGRIFAWLFGLFIVLNIGAFIAFVIAEGGGTTQDETKQRKIIMDYLKEADPENEYVIVKKIACVTESEKRYYFDHINYVPVEKGFASSKCQSKTMRYLVANKDYPEAPFAISSSMEEASFVPFIPPLFQLGLLSEVGYGFTYNYNAGVIISIDLMEYEKNGVPYWHQAEDQTYPITDEKLKKKLYVIAERQYAVAKQKYHLLTISKLSDDYGKSEDELIYGGATFGVNGKPYDVTFTLDEGVEGVYQKLLNGDFESSSEARGADEFFRKHASE